MSRITAGAIAAVLICSAVVTAMSSAIVSPGNAPDERHHYAYVQHVAANPLPFPPRYEQMRTGFGELNHLIHPPLYYQLMAIPYWLLNVEGQMTDVGRASDSQGGGVSSSAAIPALRAASLLFAFAHLVGVFLLLRYMVTEDILPPWAAVIAAAGIALVPAITLIGGMLNNDVLALALWPFLALVTLRFVREGARSDAYAAVGLAAAAVLTKATLWVLAAVVAVALLGRGLVDVWGTSIRRSSGLASAAWRHFRPTGMPQWAGAGIAVAGVVAALVLVGTNVVRYGGMQPGYSTVHGLAPEESKFFNGPPADRMSPLEFSAWASTLLLRSLYGILTHNERIYAPSPGRLTQVALALTLVSVAVVVWRLVRGDRGASALVATAFLAIPSLFMVVFLVRTYGSYHRTGHLGAQGRYLIGYAGLWVIGVLVAVTGFTPRMRGLRLLARSGAAVVAGALVLLLVAPGYYLSQTAELHLQADVPQLVAEEAAERGMQEIELEPVAPDRFVENGLVEGGILPSPRWLLAWTDSTLTGPLPHDGGCVEVWVYGRGDEAWGQKSILEISVFESTQNISEAGAVSIVSRSGELPAFPEVLQMTLDVAPYEGDEALLAIRHANVRAEGPPVVGWFGKRTRVVALFAAYSRPASC